MQTDVGRREDLASHSVGDERDGPECHGPGQEGNYRAAAPGQAVATAAQMNHEGDEGAHDAPESGEEEDRAERQGVEHGLAAIYIGFSLAYRHRLIGWADLRFAHRFADGPAPQKLCGKAYTRRFWGDVVRTSLAAVIAGALTAALTWWISDPAKTDALRQNYHWLDLVAGSIAPHQALLPGRLPGRRPMCM